jgi:cell division protein FtsQ
MLKISKIILNILLVALVLAITLMWFRENKLFVIDQVKVEGNKILSYEEILKQANLDLSKDIFEIDLDAVEERLITHELIEDVDISRFLPSALKIEIIEKDIIANVSESKLIAIDSKGNVVETERYFALYDLPIITGTNLIPDSLGQLYAPPIVQEMVTILKAIRKINLQLYHDISEINFQRNYGILLFLRKNAIPIILGYGNYQNKMYNLSLIYNLLNKREELLSLKSIDVRFQSQVVVRN